MFDRCRLVRPVNASTKGGTQVLLKAGTLVRQVQEIAGATHFLASYDGIRWLPYQTAETIETEAA